MAPRPEQVMKNHWFKKGTFYRSSGWRTPSRPGHRGVDDACNHRNPAYWPCDGVAWKGFEGGGAGNWVNLQHESGLLLKLFHLAVPSLVKPYNKVKAGELAGYADSTGSSTGDHGHEEFWWGGVDINPDPYLTYCMNNNLYVGEGLWVPDPALPQPHNPAPPTHEDDDMWLVRFPEDGGPIWLQGEGPNGPFMRHLSPADFANNPKLHHLPTRYLAVAANDPNFPHGGPDFDAFFNQLTGQP